MSRKNKKLVATLTLASAITVYISISAIGSLLGIPKWILSYSTGAELFAIAPGIKKYKSIVEKKKKKHDAIVLLAKS